jgi:hypothetical protein
MPFLAGIFTKIQIIIAAVVAALLPILYIIGRRDGAKGEVVKQTQAALEAEKTKAEFYQDIQEANNEVENSKPRSRGDLINRLRGRGL